MRAVFAGHVEAYEAIPLITDACADEERVIELGAIDLEAGHDRAGGEGRVHVRQLRPADADITTKIPPGKITRGEEGCFYRRRRRQKICRKSGVTGAKGNRCREIKGFTLAHEIILSFCRPRRVPNNANDRTFAEMS
ncbi:MAG: hypothetical protein NVSMB26_05340 [Beijerinckiaceae bacterium]